MMNEKKPLMKGDGRVDEFGKHSISATCLPILICSVAIPLSMLMWIGNFAFSFFTTNEYSSRLDARILRAILSGTLALAADVAPPSGSLLAQHQVVLDSKETTGEFHLSDIRYSEAVIPPTRWLAATVTPLAIAAWGLRKKSLDRSGAALGLVVGFVLTLSSYSFLACLMTFFVTSSKATKFRADKKRKIEEDFKEGGQRNWIQVLCNGGMATQLALLYVLDAGCEERPIDFYKNYRSSWLGLGVLGAFACCNGDTWASELGSVVGGGWPYLITNRKRVPPGTNGGVTIPGLVFSLLGGSVIGLAYYVSVLYCVDATILAESPPQWPLVIAGAFAGLVGGLVDSFLGATLQYSGIDERTGCIVERAGKGVVHISGVQLLDNHSVNLISSVALGLLTPRLANAVWI